MTEKWQFCIDRECDHCGKVILENAVREEEVVTKCPYCDWSFVE